MTLTEMRYIVALARERHFGRAAEKCHVSQPTLSVAVKKVEGQLGFLLFERHASEVRINPGAERIIEQAKRVLEEAVKLDELSSRGKDPLQGALRVGVIYTIAPYLLPQLVPQLHARAAAMPLFLKEDFTGNLIPALKQGELDVIIAALPLDEPGLVAQPVYDEPFRLVVPADHPWADRRDVGAAALDGENLLLLGQGNCFRDQVVEACPRLAAPEGLERSLEGSSLETIRHMVASGAGAAVMPSSAADPLKGSEPLVRVLDFAAPAPKRRVGLVWRVSFPRPQAIDVVRAAVLDCRLPGIEPLGRRQE
jgi:LysR family transcriptional regulator, hydrogen peroxide-inducible genes activator